MPAMPTPVTAEALLSLSLPDKRTELIRGRLVVSEPPGLLHAEVVTRIASALSQFVRGNAPPGRVFSGDPGFWIARSPDTVRAPDVAYVRPDKLPGQTPVGFAEFAPSLAVEVLSPGDRAGEVHEKVTSWLDAGTECVWVVDPLRRQAWVHRPHRDITVLDAASALDGEDLLPGFRLPLGELFA